MLLTHLVLLSFLAGASASDAPPAETPSGGWARRWPREEAPSEREARVKRERVRLGIIEPDTAAPAALEALGEAIAGGAATSVTPQASQAEGAALAEELARLHTGAWLDREIKRHFRILDDEEEAALLMLAISEI